MAAAPLKMRAGPSTVLMRLVRAFGSAYPHHAYVFVNRRFDRIKILVHDGIGLWLAARRLNQGRFVWTSSFDRLFRLTPASLLLLLSASYGRK